MFFSIHVINACLAYHIFTPIMAELSSSPLVSVIISTYNYAYYLQRSIKSILTQTYANIELIVIDDGSTDATASLMDTYSSVQYVYQDNKGLSSARNNGIRRARGKYLVFLDADDWLQPDAIENNMAVFPQHPHIAFVSGNYFLLRAETGILEEVVASVSENHYMELLQRNYIGMHAAVMFSDWVLQKMQYDESLAACEDYDLYLRIARQYPVAHHQKFIATYYFHENGLSHNYKIMMDAIITVMKKQETCIESPLEKVAYQVGLQQWKDYHSMLTDTP